MKVLLINGSNRQKNTYGVLQQIGEILKSRGNDVEIVNLFDYELKDCGGCDETCIHNGGCGSWDGMAALKAKVLESDALVFGSPVYLQGVTSKFKTFADRTNGWVHNPELAGKPMLSVAVTAATGIKQTESFFNSYVTALGGRNGGFVGRAGGGLRNPVTKKELKKFLSLLTAGTGKYKPKAGELINFQVQKVLASKFGGGNKDYWEKKEWLDKYYYYPCRIGPCKKLFSKMMNKILNKAIKV